MLSDGLPSPWSTSWASLSAPKLGFAEHFAASARDAGFPSTPPHTSPTASHPAASTRADFTQYLPHFGSLPGHSFPTLASPQHAAAYHNVIGPVPLHGSNPHLLPTEPPAHKLKSSHNRSPDLRGWVQDAEPSRFDAQGSFTKYAQFRHVYF